MRLFWQSFNTQLISCTYYRLLFFYLLQTELYLFGKQTCSLLAPSIKCNYLIWKSYEFIHTLLKLCMPVSFYNCVYTYSFLILIISFFFSNCITFSFLLSKVKIISYLLCNISLDILKQFIVILRLLVYFWWFAP